MIRSPQGSGVEIEATDQAVFPQETVKISPAEKNPVSPKIDIWKKKLLDLSKRNRLVDFKDTKRSSLRILTPNYVTLWETLVEAEKPLEFPYIDEQEDDEEEKDNIANAEDGFGLKPRNHTDAQIITNQTPKDQQKTLRNIRNRARTAIEEQGVNVLFLSFGFLDWHESPDSDLKLSSPLVLVPVTLNNKSISDPYILELHEDEIVLNPTLQHKLMDDFGKELPDFDDECGIEEYLSQIERSVTGIPNGSVRRDVGLGLFTFLKINMYADLERNREKILSHPVVRAISGDPSLLASEPTIDVSNYDHDGNTDPVDIFQVLDADSSQQDAILLAKEGVSFVLEGPPGTGKSQTIANIIAEKLAGGKTVLFVSEKKAALDVVYRRLKDSGLNDFCLALHSHKTSKKDVLSQLSDSMELTRNTASIKDEAFHTLRTLHERRSRLKRYVSELHQLVQPLGITIYHAQGNLAKLYDYPALRFGIPGVESITRDQFMELRSLIENYSRQIRQMTGDYRDNPWYGASVQHISMDLRNAFIAELPKISRAAKEMDRDGNNFLDKTERATFSLNSYQGYLRVLTMAANAPGIPFSWLLHENLDSLESDATELRTFHDQLLMSVSAYEDTITLVTSLGGKVPFDPVPALEKEAAEEQENCLQQFILDNQAFIRWSNERSLDKLENTLNNAQVSAERHRYIESFIRLNYEEGVFDVDHATLLHRFRTQYKSAFSRLGKSFKKDKYILQAHTKQIKHKASYENLLGLLNGLSELEAIESWFSSNKVFFDDIFVQHSRGLNTDFARLQKELDLFKAISQAAGRLQRIRDLQANIQEKETSCRPLDPFYQGQNTDWDDLMQRIHWAKDFKALTSQHPVDISFAKSVCEDVTFPDGCAQLSKKLKSTYDTLKPKVDWFAEYFEERESERLYSIPFTDLADKADRCSRQLNLLEEWLDLQRSRQQLEERGYKEFLDQLDQERHESKEIVPIFERRFYTLWLDAILPKFPAVQAFRRNQHEAFIEEFVKLDKLQLDIAKERLKNELMNNLPQTDSFTKAGGEINILKAEIKKKRRIMPIRKLFAKAPNMIMKLKPCLMMSPLSVSVFLESDQFVFDTVIFDEASQVCTENAIGAILRGKQVIIAGDSKQLPPTAFFAASIGDTEYDEDSDEYYQEGFESVLDEASVNLNNQPLMWHYRSRHEHLIAFSNAQYYRSNLITFPSNVERMEDHGVEYIYLANGVYDRGGTKTNRAEAKKVADLVFEHLNKFPNRSLGVVAFSSSQSDAIEAAVRAKRLDNPKCEPFFTEEGHEPFFIKNLENVQGDERDTIIFSIGYAKDRYGKMSMLFGPLSHEGGERRLNVAITRAKHNVKLVGSIRSTDIEESRITADGPKQLRKYIEFAMRGPEVLNHNLKIQDTAQHDSEFEESVYNFLVSKGYRVSAQVGCSGYRIDMAVQHPELDGRYVLGVECDGASYHSTRTVRERDRVRQAILEDMGWKIYRIWSTDWIKDAHAEQSKLIDKVEEAINTYIDPFGIQGNHADRKTSQTTVKGEKDNNDHSFLVVEPKNEEDHTYGFEDYRMTDPEEIRTDKEWWQLGYSLENHLLTIVRNESPVQFEWLCSRLAVHFGQQRVTDRIRDGVQEVIDELDDQVLLENGFVYTNPKGPVIARVAGERKIHQIAEEELILAVRSVASSFVGCTRDELIAEVSRALGYNRTGKRINERLSEIIAKLIAKNKLTEQDGKISPNVDFDR